MILVVASLPPSYKIYVVASVERIGFELRPCNQRKEEPGQGRGLG